MQETLCEAVSAVGLRYLYEILDREPRQYTMTVRQAGHGIQNITLLINKEDHAHFYNIILRSRKM